MSERDQWIAEMAVANIRRVWPVRHDPSRCTYKRPEWARNALRGDVKKLRELRARARKEAA